MFVAQNAAVLNLCIGSPATCWPFNLHLLVVSLDLKFNLFRQTIHCPANKLRLPCLYLWCPGFSCHLFESTICWVSNWYLTCPLFLFSSAIILVQVLIISYQLFSVVLKLLPHLGCRLLLLMTPPPNTTANITVLKQCFQHAIFLLK